MTTRAVSNLGLFTLASLEGLVPTRYKDIADVDTWGFGHTAKAGTPPDPRTMSYRMPANARSVYQEAWEVFKRDVQNTAHEVILAFGPGLATHELDGLTIWNYNTGGAMTTGAAALWKRGDKIGACKILALWDKITGPDGVKRRSEQLATRRREEITIIVDAEYPTRHLNVWPTDGHTGKVIWTPLESFTFYEWMDLIEGSHDVEPGGARDLKTDHAWAAAAVLSVGTAVAAFWDKIEAFVLELFK